MGRNLKYQFLFAINNNFKEKMDKHSLKKQGKMNGTRIFSYADRKNLIDFSANFSNFLKEKYPNIKLAKDIKSEHIQAFLNEKSQMCSKKTLEQYVSKFNKLENLLNASYGDHFNYKGYFIPVTKENTKIRQISMSEGDFKKLRQAFSNTNSNAKTGIELAHRCGLRVSEVTKLKYKDIDLENNVIRIVDSKGKRSRDIPIQHKDLQYFTELKQMGKNVNSRVCPVQVGSINTAIRRKLLELGLADKYEKTTIHAIRKMYAQDRFNTLRKEGNSIQKSLGIVSVELGHGENRKELMRQYVLDIK